MARMHRYGAWVARRARLVLIVWLLAAAAALAVSTGVIGSGLFAHLQQEEPYVPGEAHTGNDRLLSGKNAGGTVLLRLDGVSAAEQRQIGPAVQRALTAVPHAAAVESAFSPAAVKQPAQGAPFRSRTSPESLAFSVTLDAGIDKTAQESAATALTRAAENAAAPAHARVTTTGSVPVLRHITGQVEKDLRTGEGIAFPATLIVMVIVFGGFVAAGIPLLGAVAAIAGGLLSLLGFAQVMDLDATVVNIVTILGLGLSIDYGLLIVSRFREELTRLRPATDAEITASMLSEATAATVATAGRTVLFSGLTVAISVAGLVLFPATVTQAIGVAGLSVVLVACLAALTLVPACCHIAGQRLARKRVQPDADHGRFANLAYAVQRHVWLSIAGVVAILLLLASPLLGMRQVSSSGNLLPSGDVQRTALEGLKRDFPALAEPDVTVVARTDLRTAGSWATRTAAHLPHVAAVNPPRSLGEGYVAIGLRLDDATPSRGNAADVVTNLRTHRPPFPNWVTGQQAKLMDYSDAIRSRAPYVALVVALATIILLFLMTGSIALPLKALLFNALSLGASLGALTFIFQNGHLEGLLGYTSNDAIESVVPVILMAFGFGLAMDYEVFLLSRIVEAHRAGEDDGRAVALGVQRSGRIVTSAAVLIVIVMLGFAAAKLIVVKQIGVGLALSILLDASLVRMILVPATMTVLGRWNWWAPGPLSRWHERHGLTH